jgi:cell division protein FtsI/penicillin-binding protein 2
MNDPTRPMINRAFMERRAPGSTFKMITAVAGLERGSITPTSTIFDGITFRRAGAPYLSCASAGGHGRINVARAIAVSCNYFFCETIFRLGNTAGGNMEDSISALNDYMIAFGLNDRTGVEIGEAYDRTRSDTLNISSPEFKEFIEKSRNPDVARSRYRWYDGDTVATAIGQSFNDYTVANMAKYIATLASGGIRHQMHLVGRREDAFGDFIERREPVVEYELDLRPSTWNAVTTGMLQVTTSGTGQTVFSGFPIPVAGKTGTAQEDLRRIDHSAFGGYAPYEDPQIAVYVRIPFGNTVSTPQPAARIARDVIAAYFGLDAEPERPMEVNILAR